MADHIRTQCRSAVVTALTGLATTGSRVTGGRPKSRPVQESELPCLVVYTDDTEAEPSAGSRGARRMEESCTLVVHGYAQDKTDLDKKLDTIEKEVRTALAADPTLGGKAKDLWFTRSSKESETDVDKPTGEISITFTLEYHTREGVPDAALA